MENRTTALVERAPLLLPQRLGIDAALYPLIKDPEDLHDSIPMGRSIPSLKNESRGLPGNRAYQFCEQAKVTRLQIHSPERVVGKRILPCRDQDQVRVKRADSREDLLLESPEICITP